MFLVAVRNFDSDLEAMRWTTTSHGARERPQKEIGYRAPIEMAFLLCASSGFMSPSVPGVV
jgi:hypothetical protein